MWNLLFFLLPGITRGWKPLITTFKKEWQVWHITMRSNSLYSNSFKYSLGAHKSHTGHAGGEEGAGCWESQASAVGMDGVTRHDKISTHLDAKQWQKAVWQGNFQPHYSFSVLFLSFFFSSTKQTRTAKTIYMTLKSKLYHKPLLEMDLHRTSKLSQIRYSPAENTLLVKPAWSLGRVTSSGRGTLRGTEILFCFVSTCPYKNTKKQFASDFEMFCTSNFSLQTIWWQLFYNWTCENTMVMIISQQHTVSCPSTERRPLAHHPCTLMKRWTVLYRCMTLYKKCFPVYLFFFL